MLGLSLQLLEKIQDSTATMKDSTATSSAVSNLERRLAVLEEQAAENQYNLVRNL